MNNSCLA